MFFHIQTANIKWEKNITQFPMHLLWFKLKKKTERSFRRQGIFCQFKGGKCTNYICITKALIATFKPVFPLWNNSEEYFVVEKLLINSVHKGFW